MEEGNVSVRFSFSQQPSSNSAAHFLSFPDGFVSSLHSSLAFFFYSFDFSSLDLISASPPTDPDPICAPFLLLPSSSLYSAPCGWLGNGKCWAPLYNYNQGAREHTHKHTCPSSLWALLPLRKKKKWMDARRHFLSPFSFCPRNFDSSHGGLY